MKKIIGISFTTTNLSYYLSWFTKEDLENVELIELNYEQQNEESFKECDGFILSGGIDIDPGMYGGNINYENRPTSFRQDRDDFEAKIFNHSQLFKKPLLGICRGLQLVNVLLGGKLIQDLGEDGNYLHQNQNRKDKEHEIVVDKNSLLFEITQMETGEVNSAHHQAVDPNMLGENLQVNCFSRTASPFVEGIEFKDKTNKAFMLCVQWHPERMQNQENAFTKSIKRSFLQAMRNS